MKELSLRNIVFGGADIDSYDGFVSDLDNLIAMLGSFYSVGNAPKNLTIHCKFGFSSSKSHGQTEFVSACENIVNVARDMMTNNIPVSKVEGSVQNGESVLGFQVEWPIDTSSLDNLRNSLMVIGAQVGIIGRYAKHTSRFKVEKFMLSLMAETDVK